MKPNQSKGFIIFLEVFLTETNTAKKEIIIKIKLRPVHQNGTKKSSGVTIQWIKHKVEDANPNMSEFFKIILIDFNLSAKKQI